jgi:luciferase family oxidoreductase group 1
MRLSVLDQSPIPEGFTGADALHNTIDLAIAADELGYHRYWVAEHHGGPMLASASPEALIGPIAAATTTIRVGSGGVMLPHYSPLKVAETFTILAALYPGRIDLGLGRASGTDPLTTFALQRDRRQAAPDDFPNQLAELLAYFEDDLPADHPFRHLAATLPGLPALPDPWLLGSSPQSAIWAGELGLPYAFADFINPGGAEIAALYRERFSPARALAVPQTAVAAWVLCAPTDEEAEHLATSSRMTLTLLRRGQLIPVPPPRKAVEFLRSEGKLGPAAPPTPGGGSPGAGKLPGRRGIIGSPEKVRAELEQLASEYGAEEVIVVTITHDHDARKRSYALLAEACGLDPSSARLAASTNP